MLLIFLSAFNAQNTIRKTLESFLNQTFSNWEAWLIDDFSQDNTFQILEEFAQKDVRFKIWKNEKNLGLTKSLNVLWEKLYALPSDVQSTIKYIARFDADDVMYPEKLQIQVDFLEKNLHVSLVGAFADCENPQRADFYQNLPINTEDINIHLLFSNPIIHSNAVIRVSDWQQHIKYYDENYRLGQDFEAWTRMIQKGLIIQNIPQRLIHYTDLPTRITNVKHDILTESFYKIRAKNLKYFFEIEPSPLFLDLCHGLVSVYPNEINLDFLENLEKFALKILEKNQAPQPPKGEKMQFGKIIFNQKLLFDFLEKRIQKYLAGNTKFGYKFGVFFSKNIFSTYKNFSFFQKIKFWTKIFLKL